MLGAVIARPTFRIEEERLVPTPETPWPIDAAPVETPHGTLPADTPFLSGGIDLFVMGNAYAPGGHSATEVRVDIRVGSTFQRSIRVVGDRVWRAAADAGPQRGPTRLEASPPAPFVSMPLTYDRAFGGKARTDTHEYAYPANPLGRGFYLTAESAAGNPLPNIEDAAAPIRSVEDRPEPIGTAPYPIEGSLRPLNALELDVDHAHPLNTTIRRIKPLFFNSAHPRMIIPPADSPRPGEPVEVTNLRPSGALRFALPMLALHAHVQLEDRQYIFPLHLDQIGILGEENRVFLSYRVAFKYRVVPLERRRTTLYKGAAPARIPTRYAVAWEA
jgi:hypothetical protein